MFKYITTKQITVSTCLYSVLLLLLPHALTVVLGGICLFGYIIIAMSLKSDEINLSACGRESAEEDENLYTETLLVDVFGSNGITFAKYFGVLKNSKQLLERDDLTQEQTTQIEEALAELNNSLIELRKESDEIDIAGQIASIQEDVKALQLYSRRAQNEQ